MRRSGLALAAALLAVAVSVPTSAVALTLYDNFAGPLIDPSKWFGTDAFGGSSNPTTEFARQIVWGSLRLAATQYGLANTDSGASSSAIRLRVSQNPASITTMQARVTVTAGNAEVCPTNTSATSKGRAQIVGAFFNDGTSSGAGDETGDIFAGIQMAVDGTLGNVVEAFFSRCTNAGCSNSTVLTVQQFTTTWALNRADTLTLQWDAANNQFVYSVKAGWASAETIRLPYTQSDSAPAVVAFKQLAANTTAPDCNGSQLQSRIDARFDSFMIAP